MIVYLLDSKTSMEVTMPSALYSSVAAADVNATVSLIVPVESPAMAIALSSVVADLKAVGNVVSGTLLVRGASFTNADLPEVVAEEVDSGEDSGEEVVESG